MLNVALDHMRSDVARGGWRGVYLKEAYMRRLEACRGVPGVGVWKAPP